MESRALGRYPTGNTFGVWSDSAWHAAIKPRPWTPHAEDLPEIGCDPARYGSDYTAIHVRWGIRSKHHERHNGWDTGRTARRLREMADHWASEVNARRPKNSAPIQGKEILVKIDGDGLGVGVLDQSNGYRFVSVCASSRALRESEFTNRRPELWFTTARLASAGKLDLSELDRETLARLRQQFMAPKWELRNGLCYIEPKEITKGRLGFSPDDADGLNLSFARAGTGGVPKFIGEPATTPLAATRGAPQREQQAIGLFGRRR